VKRWFGSITWRTIQRGNFSSVKQLITKIEQFVSVYNKSIAPFQLDGHGGLNSGEASEAFLANLRDATLD
jgi:hypothetical protein